MAQLEAWVLTEPIGGGLAACRSRGGSASEDSSIANRAGRETSAGGVATRSPRPSHPGPVADAADSDGGLVTFRRGKTNQEGRRPSPSFNETLARQPWLVVRGAVGLAGSGVAIGLLASLLFSQTLTSLLFDIAPFDAATLAGVSLLLLAVAAVAAWSPARRASRVDPLVALRTE